jgi:hypothetical protein
VLVEADQDLGVHPRHQRAGGADGAVLPWRIQGHAEEEGGDVFVVGLGPAEHGDQAVVDGGGGAAPAVHRQLGPQGDAGVGVAPQVAGQSALDEAGVGALAVDQEELATLAGGDERLAFGIHGLAHPGGADDQPGAPLHAPRDRDEAAAVGPAEVAVDLHAQGWDVPVVVAHQRGLPHGRGHTAGGVALLPLDLGGVDRLPPTSQVQRGREQPDRDGEGELGPQECARHRQMPPWGAVLAQPVNVAREVMRECRAGAALQPDHTGERDQGGEGELPPAQAGDPYQGLAGGPGEQGEGAEEEQAQGDHHAQLAAGGWAAGGQAVTELVVEQRPGRVAPAPGRLVAAPAGVVGCPAAPAPRVLWVPAHAVPPRTGR